MRLPSYLHVLSERETEAYVDGSLSAKCSSGLAVDEAAPDHTTLTKLKRTIEKRAKEDVLNELLDDVVARAIGLPRQSVGEWRSEPSRQWTTHTLADVNVSKADHLQARRKPRWDRDAR